MAKQYEQASNMEPGAQKRPTWSDFLRFAAAVAFIMGITYARPTRESAFYIAAYWILVVSWWLK